jgi:hypothetical protein
MKTRVQRKVSPGNPCPFLRALVAQGLLDDQVATIGDATATIERVAATGEGEPQVPALAVRLIALLANGLFPTTVLDNAVRGMKLDRLRGGPLDKQGAGSRILDADANVDRAELDRLEQFATSKTARDGKKELGLSLEQLQKMMDANYARAEGHRRLVDRQLMNGEWPVLLEVMGKPGKRGRYLSVDEVRTLFLKRTLPARMMKRLA